MSAAAVNQSWQLTFLSDSNDLLDGRFASSSTSAVTRFRLHSPHVGRSTLTPPSGPVALTSVSDDASNNQEHAALIVAADAAAKAASTSVRRKR